MSLSQTVARDLPRLRRYARALSGTQTSGDAYIAATLEALIEDPGVVSNASNPTVGLFHAFTRIWNSAGQTANPAAEASAGPDKHIEKLMPLPRQAFLLVALEDFPEEQTSEILGIGADEVADLIAESGREIAQDIATDVLIIEDEPLIAMDLESLVESLGHSVTGIARTHDEAVALAAQKTPGLILADIQLADRSSGIDAVNELLQSFEVPVIFITAFPEKLLTGERPEPAFLITKPFRPAMVSAVISQALFFERHANAPA